MEMKTILSNSLTFGWNSASHITLVCSELCNFTVGTAQDSFYRVSITESDQRGATARVVFLNNTNVHRLRSPIFRNHF